MRFARGRNAGMRRLMHGVRLIEVALVGTLLAACAPPDDWFGAPDDGFVRRADVVVDGTDWSAAETIAVTVSEFRFSPEVIRLKQGQPYVLRLTNAGVAAHRFVAPEFFRAVAVRRLRYSDAEAGFPVLEAVALDPDETKVLYFLPVKRGNYGLVCDRTFHEFLGMSGQIVVE